jgi:N-acetylmuramoyl-L-alanine amidase
MAQIVRWIGSTNRATGRQGYRPRAVVIHIMDDDIGAVDAWFNTPKGPKNPMPVSAHYGIARSGAVHQYVNESDTAWHAGRVKGSHWPGLSWGPNPNLYTIGVEHEGTPEMVWTDAMRAASATLLAGVSQRWSIPLDRLHVIGHYEIYSPKSYCPGPHAHIDELIDMAQQVVLSAVDQNFVSAHGTVDARTRLNVRTGAPSSLALLARTVAAGESLPYVGWTSNGESVHGNAHWYRDADGNYFWAGGTTVPVPGVS